MYRLICQKPAHFLSAQMALVSTFFQMFIVLGMYNFCHRTKKCIHPDARCDLHPHHACVYKDQKGEFVKKQQCKKATRV